MDNSLLGSGGGSENNDDEEGGNDHKLAYYTQPLENSSSDEEDNEGTEEVKGAELDEGEENGGSDEEQPYGQLGDEDDDDDFEEFQSSSSFQPMEAVHDQPVTMPEAPPSCVNNASVDGDTCLPPTAPAASDETSEEETATIPQQLPSERIAPLTADRVEQIKKAMSNVKISPRSGPIVSIASKLEGVRVGDECNEV
jgi:hypothetical protein